MGKFKNFLTETDDLTQREPGEIAGNKPHATAEKTMAAANKYTARHPNFSADVQNAPNDQARANVISRATSDVLKRPGMQKSNMTPDVLQNQFATNSGYKPEDLFKRMKKMMGKK